MRHLCQSALLLAAVTAPGWGQTHPDVNGTWTLDTLRSRFEKKLPAPKKMVMQIEYREPNLRITRTVVRGGDETKDVFEIPADWTEHQVTIAGQPASVRAAWEGDHLILESHRNTPKGPVVVSRRIRVGDKHKILTTVLTVKDGEGEKTAYEFFTRETTSQ